MMASVSAPNRPGSATRPLPTGDALIEALASGRVRRSRLGQHVDCRLTPVSRREYERAKRVGFLSRRMRDAAQNLYWEWAEVHGRPVVTIRPKVKYATVSLDMIVCGWRLDAAAMDRVNRLRNRESYPWGDASPEVCYVLVERVPLAEAETVAFRLFEIAMDCRPDGD